jgi:transposase
MKFAVGVALIWRENQRHASTAEHSLVPSGFVVVTAVHDTATTTITVRSPKDFGVCPSCSTVSRRVHSRYHRRVGDLPLSGRSVNLLVVVRRFRGDAVLCKRQIVCDLERRRPVTLLPDREPATAAAWLEQHQEITVVARAW